MRYPLILLILLCGLAQSCTTTRKVSEVRNTTETYKSGSNDSIRAINTIIRDSIETTRLIYIKGDTVFVYRDRVKTHTLTHTDTVAMVHTDTIYIRQAEATATRIKEQKNTPWWLSLAVAIAVAGLVLKGKKDWNRS